MDSAINDVSLHSLPHTDQALLPRIQEICDRFHIVSLNRQIEASKNLLSQDKLIDVAILGQFKTGKSCFLNSLTGKPILPVGVIPVTTTITRLQYGKKERAIIRHFDGRQTEVDVEAIEDFTSEAKNPGNQKNVEMVDVELPSLEKHAGLRLVDTPGLGSIFKYHMETSENWLPEAGMALLAISSDRPLAANDLELVRDLRKHTPRIVILLTKADLLSPDQQKEVVDFFHAALQRELHEQFPIFLYSTRQDTEQWKQRLEDEVFGPLTAHREEEFQNILIHKVQSIGKSCLGYLEVALKASLKVDLDREQLRKQILDEKVNYELVRQEVTLITREHSQQTRELIQNSEGISHISKTEHKHFFGTLKKARASLSRSLEAFRTLCRTIISSISNAFKRWVDWPTIAFKAQPALCPCPHKI